MEAGGGLIETDANSASSSSRVLAPGGSMLGPVREAEGCACGGGGGGGDPSVENPGSRSSRDSCRMVANAVCARTRCQRVKDKSRNKKQ